MYEDSLGGLGADTGVLYKSRNGSVWSTRLGGSEGAVSRKTESLLTEQVSSFSRSTNPVFDESPADISSGTAVATIAAHSA